MAMYREPERVAKEFRGVSRTKQSFRDETNINTILAKWARDGVIESGVLRDAKFGDFSAAMDLHSALNKVNDAERDFMLLPSKVRKYCNNSPVEFLELIEDSTRHGELQELGILGELEHLTEPEKGAKVSETAENPPAEDPGAGKGAATQ